MNCMEMSNNSSFPDSALSDVLCSASAGTATDFDAFSNILGEVPSISPKIEGTASFDAIAPLGNGGAFSPPSPSIDQLMTDPSALSGAALAGDFGCSAPSTNLIAPGFGKSVNNSTASASAAGFSLGASQHSQIRGSEAHFLSQLQALEMAKANARAAAAAAAGRTGRSTSGVPAASAGYLMLGGGGVAGNRFGYGGPSSPTSSVDEVMTSTPLSPLSPQSPLIINSGNNNSTNYSNQQHPLLSASQSPVSMTDSYPAAVNSTSASRSSNSSSGRKTTGRNRKASAKRAAASAASTDESSGDEDSRPSASGPTRGNSRRKAAKSSLANLTEEEKIIRRRKKNREAAQQSRLRKRLRLETLETQLNEEKARHHRVIAEKEVLERENDALRKQLDCLKDMLDSFRGAATSPSATL